MKLLSGMRATRGRRAMSIFRPRPGAKRVALSSVGKFTPGPILVPWQVAVSSYPGNRLSELQGYYAHPEIELPLNFLTQPRIRICRADGTIAQISLKQLEQLEQRRYDEKASKLRFSSLPPRFARL